MVTNVGVKQGFPSGPRRSGRLLAWWPWGDPGRWGVGGGEVNTGSASGAGANGPASNGPDDDDDGSATAASCSWSSADQTGEPWALWILLSALAMGRRRARAD